MPPSARTRWGRLALLLRWGLLAAAAGACVASLTGWVFAPLAVLAAFVPYLSMATLAAAALAVVGRRWRWLAAFTLLTVALLVPLLPQFRAVEQPQLEHSTPLTLLASNIKLGQADVGQLAQLVASQQVDVLVLTELTEDAARRATEVDLDAALPYHAIWPAPGAAGTGIWSRYPLGATTTIDQMSSVNLRTTLTAPGARPVTLVAAHPTTVFYPRDWARQAHTLRDAVAEVSGPVIIAGDFNATSSMAPVRTLQKLGYRNVNDSLGRGLSFTWSPLVGGVPMLRLDHVLVRGPVAARSIDRENITGSDHRAVLVRLDVPAELPAPTPR